MARDTTNARNAGDLADDLLAAIQEEEASEEWRSKMDREFKTIERGGSSNIPILAAAIGLLVTQPPERGKIFQWWHAYFDRSERRFMESEPFSRIYCMWMVLPVATVYCWASERGNEALAEKARKWLRAFWSYCALCAGWGPQAMEHGFSGVDPRGLAVALCGARSYSFGRDGTPHHLEGHDLDVQFALAIGWNGVRPRRGTWEFRCFKELRTRFGLNPYGLDDDEARTLRQHVEGELKTQELIDFVQDHRPITPFRFFRTTHGVASLMLRGVNKNTAPLYGVTWRHDPGHRGHTGWLAADPGDRRNIDPGVGWYEDGELKCSRADTVEAGKENVAASIPMPPGDVVVCVETGPRDVREVNDH